MTEVALREDAQAPATAPQQRNLVSLIEQIMLRPEIDVEKIERFLDMQQKIEAKQAEQAYNEDLSAMQLELPAIRKRGKSNNHTYAKWEDVQQQIAPVLAKFGFSITHKTRVEGELVVVTCIIRHCAGHKDETELPLPFDKGTGRNSVQAVGSSISYGKRYTAAALLGIRVEGEDDDGNGGAPPPPKLADEQIIEIRNLLNLADREEGQFVKYLNAKGWKGSELSEIDADVFPIATKFLRGKIEEPA